MREEMKELNPRLSEIFLQCSRDFLSDFDENGYAWGHEVEYSRNGKPMSYMVYICFVVILGYKFWGQEEKVAWTIPFTYKGEAFIATHRKLGFRICAAKETSKAGPLVLEMLLKLKNMIRLADGIVEPIIKEQVAFCNCTILNKYSDFMSRYEFFREKADSTFKTPPPPRRLDEPLGEVPSIWSFKNNILREGFYYTQAMLDAYFSYLEHVLVLLVSFEPDFDRERDSLDSIIFSDWTSKYNRIIKPESNPKGMRYYNKLKEIKEKFRNTFAHGGFEKNGSPYFVHFPGLGAIPLSLSKFTNSVHFHITPIREIEFSEICTFLDEFEDYLEGLLFRPMQIIKAGIDISYNEPNRKEYQLALRSDEDVEEFIEHETYLWERQANMEW